MADENVIIEENEQNVGEYDPNPYDNVTVEEALKQLFNRFTPRTVRQAIFTMAENNKPATLIEKSITANDIYNASDDNADGYSSVTVDVEAMFTTMITYSMNYASDSAIRVMLCRSTDGNYQPPYGDDYPLQMTLLDPAIKVIAGAPGMTITFTPDENFDGFYSVNGNKMIYTGDTVVPGDGKVYRFICTMSGNTMLKTDADFYIIIS